MDKRTENCRYLNLAGVKRQGKGKYGNREWGNGEIGKQRMGEKNGKFAII